MTDTVFSIDFSCGKKLREKKVQNKLLSKANRDIGKPILD